jgi:uncharacterized protein YqeY
MLRDRLAADLGEAIKGGDGRRACTLRLILAAVKDRESGGGDEAGQGMADEDIEAILARMVAQREESARDYEEAGRLELAAQERDEIKIIRTYLPRPMSEAEVERAVECAIRDCGARSIRDMGRIMAHLKANHSGRMDFAKAGAAVKTALR